MKNKSINTIEFFLILLFILFFINPACAGKTISKKDFSKNIGKIEQKAILECSKLPPSQSQLCVAVIEKRMANYLLFDVKSKNRLNELEKEYRLAASERARWKMRCKMDKAVNCVNFARSNRRVNRYKATLKSANEAVGKSRSRLLEAVKATPNLSKKAEIQSNMLCEISGLGQIKCQSVAEVLALLEPKFGVTLINDLIQAEKFFTKDKYDTLLDCGFGILTAVDSGSDISSIANSWSVFDNKKKTLLLEACAEAGQSSGGSGGGGGPPGGFSGVSGFDPFRGNCALSISFESPVDLIGNMANAMKQFYDSCNGEGTPSVASGGSPWRDWVDPYGPIKPDLTGNVFDIDFDNLGDVTIDGEATGTIGGSGGTLTSYENDDFADGHTQSVNVVKDNDGDIVWIEAEANYPDGTSSTYSYTLDKGTGTETHEYTNRDGSSIKSTYEHNGTETHEVNTGNGEEGYESKMNADGSTTYTDTDENGNVVNEITTDSEGNVTSWKRNGQTIVGGASCSDPELCSTCGTAPILISVMANECAGSMGSSYACQAFFGAQSCCSDPGGAFSDPTVAMPNPEGDFICVGGDGGPSREDRCRAFCSVASSDVDCYNNCLSEPSTVGGVPYSFMEKACLYAISEECFQSGSIVPPITLGSGPVTGNPPIPATSGGLVLEPILDRDGRPIF